MKPPRSFLKMIRTAVGLILIVVTVPGVIVLTWEISVGNDFAHAGHGQRLLLICIVIALIGASMVGRLNLPYRRTKKPSDSADTPG